jgi:hypothetical protein
MPKNLDAKRIAAREKALDGLAEVGVLDDQMTDAARDPDNPPLGDQFWQRLNPLTPRDRNGWAVTA